MESERENGARSLELIYAAHSFSSDACAHAYIYEFHSSLANASASEIGFGDKGTDATPAFFFLQFFRRFFFFSCFFEKKTINQGALNVYFNYVFNMTVYQNICIEQPCCQSTR